jgi:hypothetical protein
MRGSDNAMNGTYLHTQVDTVHPVVRLVLMLVLLTLGGACIYAGCDVIVKRHHEVKWRTSGIGGSSRGVAVYDGAESVRFGTGLAALGTMATLYAIGVGAGFFRRHPSATSLKPFTRIIAGLALACLLLAMGCFAPPWRLSSIPFYIVVLLVFAITRFANPRGWARVFLPCLFAGVVGAEAMHRGSGRAIFLGLFAGVGILMHVIALSPKWAARLQ